MPTLTLQPVVGPAFVAFVMAVLVGLLFVRPRHARLSGKQLIILAGLRLAVVVLTLCALLRPTLVYTELRPQPASLVLLLDGSRSMEVEDSLGGASRWSTLRSLLAESSADLATLNEKLNLKAYRFAERIEPVVVEAGRLSLPPLPTGEQTALGAALEDVVDREASVRVLGVLLVTDGAQRAVAPRDLAPQIAARRLAAESIPLYTFALGQPGGSSRADLRIDDLVTSDTIFVDAPTQVQGQLVAAGYANQPVRVQLLWETDDGTMEVVDAVQLTTPGTGAPLPFALRYTPLSPGERKVMLRVEPREAELVTSNNEAGTFVSVREGGINVLYLAGTKKIGGQLGREQRFVRESLDKSPDIVVERQRFDYRRTEQDVSPLFAPGKWDLVILDDLDRVAFNEASWRALARSVQAGTGLMMLGGYHSFGPGGYRGSPVADLLPIDIGPAENQTFGEPLREDVHLPGPLALRRSVPLGVRHPIMQLGSDLPGGVSGEAAWSSLPPLDGANRFEAGRLKPNAQLLAESADAARHPLLVAGQSGAGRTLAFAGDSTFRWVLTGQSEAHRQFWRQCVLWLSGKDAPAKDTVWVRLPQRRVPRGSRVDLEVGATDAEQQPIEQARCLIEVEAPDGSRSSLPPTQRGSSWTAAFRDTQVPGDYTVRVRATGDDGRALGTAQARFLVPERDLELDRPAAERSLLRQLAMTTAAVGGAAMAPEELPALLRQLASEPPLVKQEVLAKVTYWDRWPFLVLFVTLLAVEWYLRKRWGLV